jgi:phage antirepressor YoqD-like protein
MSELVTISNTPNLSFFEYNSRHLRTFNDGEIAFCLLDVLNAMNSKTTTTAAITMISEGMGDGYVVETLIPDSIGREQITTFVREAALTFLLSRSRTKAGKILNRTIHTEILPSIRKTGRYEVAPVPPAPPAIPTTFREAMMLAIDLEDTRLALQAKIDGDADRVKFAEAVQKSEGSILVGTFAKTLGDVGPNILMGILRGNGILMTSTNPAKHNIPYQTYIDQGYFVVDEGTVQTGNKTRLTFTTRITPKGQIWLTNKYYEWQNVAA